MLIDVLKKKKNSICILLLDYDRYTFNNARALCVCVYVCTNAFNFPLLGNTHIMGDIEGA